MNLQYDREKLKKICEEKGISKLYLFGSFARNENTPTSDVDLLVTYNKPISLMYHAGTQNLLETVFNRSVDLTIEKNLKPSLIPYIIPDKIKLYEENK